MYLTLNEIFSKSENEVILLTRKEGDNIKCLMAVEFCLSYFYSDNFFCIVYFFSIQFPFWSENQRMTMKLLLSVALSGKECYLSIYLLHHGNEADRYM